MFQDTITTEDVSAAGTGHVGYQGGATSGAAGDGEVSCRVHLCCDHGAASPVKVSILAPQVL